MRERSGIGTGCSPRPAGGSSTDAPVEAAGVSLEVVQALASTTHTATATSSRAVMARCLSLRSGSSSGLIATPDHSSA